MTQDNGGAAFPGREAAQIAAMSLPEGKACADCRHGTRCDALFGAVRREFVSCDFYPSRFSARKGQDQ